MMIQPLNTQNVRAFKFKFDVELKKLKIAISFPCKIQVNIKRGTQKLESQQFDLVNGEALMHQVLLLETNLYLDISTKEFLEKKATFTILLITPKGQKVAGTASMDISQYARNQITEKEETLKLEKCPDKQAFLNLFVKISMLGEIEFDTISMASQASKIGQEAEESNGNEHSLSNNIAKNTIGVKFSQINSIHQQYDSDKYTQQGDKVKSPREIKELPSHSNEKLKKPKESGDNHDLQMKYQDLLKQLNEKQLLIEQGDRLNKQLKETLKLKQESNNAQEHQQLIQKLQTKEQELADSKSKAKELQIQLSEKDQQVKSLERLLNSVKQELQQTKLDFQNFKEKQNSQLEETLMAQVVQAKQQLGDIFNKAMEVGGMELFEQLQTSIGTNNTTNTLSHGVY